MYSCKQTGVGSKQVKVLQQEMCDDIKAYAVSLNIVVHTAWICLDKCRTIKLLCP